MTTEAPEPEAVGPRRTCVACREEADRDDLVRLVLDPDGAVVVDYRGKLPGRGAWVHPRRVCLDTLAREPGRLTRPFGVRVETTDIEPQLRARVGEALLDGLSMAAAAGALVGGHDLLEAALKEGRILEVLVASDASPRTIDDLRAAAGTAPWFTIVPLGREALGERIGRGARAALGVTSSRAANHLRRQLHRLRSIS